MAEPNDKGNENSAFELYHYQFPFDIVYIENAF